MKAVSVSHVRYTPDGKEMVSAVIVSDGVPSPLPTTGEGIDGMNANQVFAPLSLIYVIASAAEHKTYFADESGVFVGQ